MPSESAELPAYFDTVENVFTVYEVPNNLKAKLILPLLSFRSTCVICRLTAAQMDDYDKLKRFLLAQFKLTPREYKARFVNASKTADEAYILFKARLHKLLLYYIRSRQADGDYERLVNILVSDSLKVCLSAPALNYVMNILGDAFFEPDRVAMLVDMYANNYQDGKYKGNQITQLDADPKHNKCKKGEWHKKCMVQTEGVVPKGTYSTSYTPKVTEDRKVGARLCVSCKSPNHMLKACPSSKHLF